MQQTKTIIEPGQKNKFFNFSEFWRYKDLLYFMVLRDVTVMYKQTVLGFAWAIINPLVQIIIFSLVFGSLAGIKTGSPLPYPLFSCLAVIPWNYFSSSLGSAGQSLIGTSGMFTKVYFPRLIIPLTPILSKLVDFFISLIVLLCLMVYFKYLPGMNVFFFFIPLLLIITTATGLGLWLSTLSMQYRDFKFAMTFLMPLLMYAAPVAFPAAKVMERFGSTAYHLYAIYPMVGGIEGFRSCFIQHATMPWDIISISACSSILILLSGIYYFRKTEKFFADLA